MSGHNKWSQIKNKKAATDSKKSKIFSKLAKLISDESKKAQGNISSPGLKTAIDRAKAENMPADNIERAVKKGAGGDQGEMFPVLYESYGPGGCAIVVEGLTDNKNRTNQEVKHILSKSGYALAGQGAATWAFDKQGAEWVPNTTTPLSDEDADKLGELVELLEDHDDVQGVYTNAE